MARVKQINNSEWIVLDSKRQSNAHELVELAKSVRGVHIKNKNGSIWVRFPSNTHSSHPSIWNTRLPNKGLLKVNHKEDGELNNSRDSHYCAIMVK